MQHNATSNVRQLYRRRAALSHGRRRWSHWNHCRRAVLVPNTKPVGTQNQIKFAWNYENKIQQRCNILQRRTITVNS